jgi:hypothetical protein
LKTDADAVKAFKEHANDFQMLIFAGTWCPDTHNLCRNFIALQMLPVMQTAALL